MVKNENLLENMAKKAKIFQVKNDASKNIAKLVDGIIKNKMSSII